VERIGFTGGEPFLAPGFLNRVTRAAVRQGFLFGRLMTNGVWFANRKILESRLQALHTAGFDGGLCVSVDAFHRQELRKVAAFVRTAVQIWNRSDVVSIAAAFGARDAETQRKLARLAQLLRARLVRLGRGGFLIRSETAWIRVTPIPLVPLGAAARWKKPWGGRWFRDDYCQGPGHVFVVDPDGAVKPCCGYANELPELTLGSSHANTFSELMRHARRDPLLAAIFERGLQPIRRALEKAGWRFPGKTTSHCFFCHYLLTEVPRPLLLRHIKAVLGPR